ncbi:deoxyuridine triphosphatase [Saimiriine alphaherpesvirus 1]|uniref:Deoxyuridine triphosphatase n=1 Tax=Saimiriine herpesvirus 1 (strain MV-5-4-PSL) TaxID=10353 RepID=E2IUC0_SHV1|nr:deoxyuridine triphosphatase [Saimiriine alphaherpesvirus 1]ADO13778.1 deoxyuridine triphosphatase [Saimiriine alphaherpesvirus 1]
MTDFCHPTDMGARQSKSPMVLVGVNGAQPGDSRTSEDGWSVKIGTSASVPRLLLTNVRELNLSPGAESATDGSGFYVAKVPLGVRLVLPEGYAAILHAMVHPAFEITPGYCCANGVIDSGYRGTIAAVLAVSREDSAIFPPGSIKLCLSIIKLASSPLGLTTPVFTRRDPLAPSKGRVYYIGRCDDVPDCLEDIVGEETAFIPRRAEDAGLDVVARRRLEIPAGESYILQPSLRFLHSPVAGTCCFFGRSSLNARGLVVVPSLWRHGTECRFRFINMTGESFVIQPGARIAQLVIAERECELAWVRADAVDHDADPFPTTEERDCACGIPCDAPRFCFTDSYETDAPASVRGEGGFGSTGV